MQRKLNLDIAGSVSEFEMLMKKVLPRNIMYQLILGKGLEFDGYRDYNPSDDASLIDWKASVRGNKTVVRKYVEERDRKFIFIIDVSDNMVFGSTEKLKCEYVAEMAAAIAHLILTYGDRVGFVLFNDKVVGRAVPKVGTKQFDIFVHELSNPLIYGGASNLNGILEGLVDTFDRDTSMIFIISDFVKVDDDYGKNFETLAGLFETVAIIVRDPLDNLLPDINKEVIIQDPETGEKLLINPKVAKNLYERNSLKQLNSVKQIFRDFNIDFVEVSTDRMFSVDIANFLKERIKGGRIVKSKNVY